MADRPLAGHRWWWRSSPPRVRFSKAVPLRADRRELRRLLRSVVRTTRAERKRRLTARSSSQRLYLCEVDVCFGRCWYQLHFSGSGEVGPTVLARVTQYESNTTRVRRAAGAWRLRKR